MPYVHIANHKLSIIEYGTEFILLHSIEGLNLIPLAEAIHLTNLDFAEEIIGTETEICIKLKSIFDLKAAQQLSEVTLTNNKTTQSYTLPIYFDEDEDWSNIESHSNKSRVDIITELTSLTLEFHMYGFLPGFLYIKGLPTYLHCPRKVNPATRVAAGSLAIGGPYLGFYSNPSPGGWHCIGHCALKIFDKNSFPPTKLNHGDKINLISINQTEQQRLLHKNIQLHEYG